MTDMSNRRMSQTRVAVITGGATGIGQAIVERLAHDGCDIAIADIQPTQETEQLIAATGRRTFATRCDVTNESDVNAFATEVRDRLGGCEILVNNVGIYPMAFFEDIDFAEWRRVLSVNLDSMFLTCKAFVPAMREQRWGRIVNMASDLFMAGDPMFTHYIASKGGVIGLTRALAGELGGDGITVNAVAPSLIRVPTTERGTGPVGKSQPDKFDYVASLQAIKRTQLPSDVVGTVSFLASDDAGFITGQTVVVDGGLVRS